MGHLHGTVKGQRNYVWEWERSGIGLHMLPTCYQHSHPRIQHTSTRATQTTLLVALALTGCRNPGIVRRWPEKPPNCDHWYWSDQVGTFRPPKSQYDGDCGLIIEEFDHTCPWCVLLMRTC